MARLLEKALRRSEAVDREALCIVAGQKVRSIIYPTLGRTDARWQVWSIRVDMHFLDDEGNMLDCASIAAMAALRHFRRPDVTVLGEEVTIVRCSFARVVDDTLTGDTSDTALDDRTSSDTTRDSPYTNLFDIRLLWREVSLVCPIHVQLLIMRPAAHYVCSTRPISNHFSATAPSPSRSMLSRRSASSARPVVCPSQQTTS